MARAGIWATRKASAGLTDAELRADPVPVTLNGEEVVLWRGGSQADALFVGWNGSQQVTVNGMVGVVTQGNNKLAVDTGLEQPTTPNDIQPVTTTANGTWSYLTGVSGTVSVTGRPLVITALAANGGGTISVNGGGNIPVPSETSLTLNPGGNITNPTVVFTGTSAYLIEVVS